MSDVVAGGVEERGRNFFAIRQPEAQGCEGRLWKLRPTRRQFQPFDDPFNSDSEDNSMSIHVWDSDP
jgi:hypothetical protein